MAEPTCMMQTFSYTTSPTPFSNGTPQEINPTMYGLKDSISFGRYENEDLEWEKRSAFNNNNQNKYIAEAQKYSKPGSVAQKKAYLEAHFKRISSPKTTTLLEQDQKNVTQVNGFDHTLRNQDNHGINDTGNFVVHQNEIYSNQDTENEYEVDECKVNEVNSSSPPPPPLPPPPPPLLDNRPSQKLEVIDFKKEDNHVHNEELSSEINKQIEIPHLEEESTKEVQVKKKKSTPLSYYISSPIIVLAPSPSRADSIHPGKENYSTPNQDSNNSPTINNDPRKKRTPFRMSISREFYKILSPVFKKLGNSTPSEIPAKEKEGAKLKKFRQSFCFKAIS